MARTTSYGICELCGKRTSKAGMTRHLASHLAKGDEEGESRRLLRLRVLAAYAPLYRLDLEVDAGGTLADLDAVLRDTWLECCGHLSAFTIGGARYGVVPDDVFGERDMEVPIGDVAKVGTTFRHEYDFGSTTELKLRVQGEREGSIDGRPQRLLARNEPPAWRCSVCGAPATMIDTESIYDTGEPFRCDEHAAEVEDEWTLSPVVNSPRMGVCGYEG